MNKIKLLFLLMFITLKVQAQDEEKSSFAIGVGQDSYFGFYVTGYGSHTLSENTHITFYSNYWANPAFGNARTGTDFWTEIGGGLNFYLLEKKLNINPSLGFTYGKVLSGGEKGVVGDGIVPGLIISLNNSFTDISLGTIWFKALRKEGPITIDYVWYWLSPGYKINSKITSGIHFEDLYLSRMTEAKATNLYLWLGPFVQYNFSNGVFVKASAGYDAINNSFVKVNINIPLTK